MIDLIGTLRHIYKRVNQIFDTTTAILSIQETGGTITSTAAEQDIYRVETPLGVFEPRTMQIDFTAQTAVETVIIRVYYRIRALGNLIKKDEVTYAGGQDPDLINVELEPNRFGIQVTIQKTAGADTAYDWAVFYKG